MCKAGGADGEDADYADYGSGSPPRSQDAAAAEGGEGEVKEAVARTGPPSDRSKLKPECGDSNSSTAVCACY